MTICEWFDPHNVEHIKAYNFLRKGPGVWPPGFLPKGIEFPHMWEFEVCGVIVDAWIEHKLQEDKN